MNYLGKLIADREAREQYENDQLRLKKAINQINELHSAYDGEFLTFLEEKLKNYKDEKTKE